MIDINRIVSITNEFLKVPSSIAYEKPFLDYLQKRAENLGYNIFRKDDFYLVIKPKNKETTSSKLFSVHIDRHSVIKNEKGDLEHLAFNLKKRLGLIFLRDEVKNPEENLFTELKNNNVEFDLKGEFVLFKREGLKPVKLKRDGLDTYYETVALRYTKEDCFSYDDITGEILNEFKLIRNIINVEEDGVYFKTDRSLTENDNIFMMKSQIYEEEKFLSGQIDNVISAACLFYLMEKGEFNEEIIFTTQEEIGKSYECVLDYVNLDENFHKKIIVLDTSPYSNLEKQPPGFLTLRNGDENGEFDQDLVLEIKNLLDENKLNYDFKSSFFGRTELGRVSSESGGKVNGITLQLPSMNYHTIFETCSKKSLENYVFVIKKLLE